jgi:hypothetical protein
MVEGFGDRDYCWNIDIMILSKGALGHLGIV